MGSLTYLFAAYLVIWIGICGYMLSVDGRLRNLRQEIEALKLALEEKGAAKPDWRPRSEASKS